MGVPYGTITGGKLFGLTLSLGVLKGKMASSTINLRRSFVIVKEVGKDRHVPSEINVIRYVGRGIAEVLNLPV